MTLPRWTTTVLACDDPDLVAQFWAELLGGVPVRVSADFVVVRHGSCWLAAERTGDATPASWPSGPYPVQVHLDLAVDELQPAVDRAVGLGAREEDHQPAPDRWRVLRAPGGHLFCLSHRIRDYLPVDLG